MYVPYLPGVCNRTVDMPHMQAEAEKEERDMELTQALGRLGEYERVGDNERIVSSYYPMRACAAGVKRLVMVSI